MMTAIRKILGNKTKPSSNPFANQENKHSNIKDTHKSKLLFSHQIGSFGGKRRHSEISWDSPVINNPSNIMSDEEEKEMPQPDPAWEESVCQDFSSQLMFQLKSVSTNEQAHEMIKSWLHTYRHLNNPNAEVLEPQKKKIGEKEKKLISEAIKKLVSDNSILKKAVRKLVTTEEQNQEKARRFDDLAQAYDKLAEENLKLKNSVQILQYVAREKCDEGMFKGNNNDFDNSGGSDVY